MGRKFIKNKIFKVIIAIFLLAAMSHGAFAWSPSYNTETECRSCHGTDVSDRHHLLVANGTYQCTDCHTMKYDATTQSYYPEVIRNCLTCHPGKQHTCMECHPQVTFVDLGMHSTLNGSSAVDSGDCMICHHNPFPMVKGAVNNSNTYFCADCHTTAGTGPNKSSKIFIEKRHGKASCMDCHVADGKYHQGNPRGSVANSTYVSRYPTTNTNTTDCADCHRAANLDDAPFNAPGMGTHSVGACATGGCHGGGNNMVQVVHNTNPLDSLKPTITVPILDSSTVTQGTDVNVTVTVNFATNYASIDGAQYRVMSGTTEIKSWTPMSAIGGDFGGSSTSAIATINTNNLRPGTYTIEVRGMAGGPAQNALIRYYPMNGDVSTTKNATLTVEPPMGYINVTVTSSDAPVSEANVWINDNVIKTTDANGNYTFIVPEGTYNVTASKQPTLNDNTVAGNVVTPFNTTTVNIELVKKPTGTITGVVTNV
jgi:predicted CXXCH cytochrome family protein